MRDSLLVMVSTKVKVTERKWISAVYGKEAIAKDSIDYLTNVVPHDIPAKTEHIECLENYLAQVL